MSIPHEATPTAAMDRSPPGLAAFCVGTILLVAGLGLCLGLAGILIGAGVASMTFGVVVTLMRHHQST